MQDYLRTSESVNKVNESREYLKNLLWLRSSFGNRNPEQVAMVSIRYLVAIQGCDPNRNPDRNPGRNLRSRTFQGFRFEIATLIATLVETSVPERFRVANRVAIRVSIRNPESQPEVPKIRNPGGFSMVAIRVANRVSIAISQP